MEIRKKAWKEMFELVKNGKKKFDLRLNDREWENVKEGDFFFLEEWDEVSKKYTGRSIRKKIGFLLRTKELPFWNEYDIDEKGFIVISLEQE